MKISLKNVKNALNRDEMRAVSGGCLDGGSCLSKSGNGIGCIDDTECPTPCTCSGRAKNGMKYCK